MSLLTNEYGDGFRARKPSFFDRIPKCQRISGNPCPKEGGHFSEGDRKMRSEMSLPTGATRAAREFEGKQVSGLSRP